MAVTNCPKHGKTGFRETCEHVHAEFRRGHSVSVHPLTFHAGLLVCDECWGKYDLARLESHPDIAGKVFYEADEDNPAVQEYVGVYESLRRGGMCAKCIAEIQAGGGR
ncbi:MAG TPA: hypothetical protein VGP08_24965 [Pyrinomonadaceae bacterium]|jgi:hypothetical protein|nr:hypothetical protein [Pyrinomonadaceae bacterium]